VTFTNRNSYETMVIVVHIVLVKKTMNTHDAISLR